MGEGSILCIGVGTEHKERKKKASWVLMSPALCFPTHSAVSRLPPAAIGKSWSGHLLRQDVN